MSWIRAKKNFIGAFLIGDRVYIEHMVPIWKNVELPMNTKTPVENKYGNRFAKQECCPLIFNTIVVNPLGNFYPCTQLLSPPTF